MMPRARMEALGESAARKGVDQSEGPALGAAEGAEPV